MTNSSTAHSLVDQLTAKIQEREARVGIIGLGYVGLPLALLYSEQKFPVTGFDIDAAKIDTLDKGGSYIFRIPPDRNPGREGQRIFGDRRLFPACRDGRDHHLRPDSAE